MAPPAIKHNRNRLWYAVAILVVIVVGLSSRHYPWLFPEFMGKYPGDALWALMVFLGWGVIFPGISTRRLAVYALATSYVDEFSQLYHAPWIDSIRSTFLGHIILGSRFMWFDFAAYAIGIFIGVLGESALRSRIAGRTTSNDFGSRQQ
jgi:hypothetical protein